MADVGTTLVAYLEQSLRTDTTHLPVQNDQAYVFTDSDFISILNVAFLAQCPKVITDITNIDLSTIPTDQVYFVILKAKEEVYYRLATSSAPFYPIEAEGASLRKDYRFEHYMALVRKVEQEYQTLWDRYTQERDVQVGEVILKGYHYHLAGYNKALIPTVSIKRIIPHSNSIDIEWSKFDVFGGLFSSYRVYLDTAQIYDEFQAIPNDYDNTILINDSSLSATSKQVQHTLNIHNTKFRIKDLIANTTYHILVVSEDRNGLRGYIETTCTTLPLSL